MGLSIPPVSSPGDPFVYLIWESLQCLQSITLIHRTEWNAVYIIQGSYFTALWRHCTFKEKDNVLSQHTVFRWICERIYSKGCVNERWWWCFGWYDRLLSQVSPIKTLQITTCSVRVKTFIFLRSYPWRCNRYYRSENWKNWDPNSRAPRYFYLKGKNTFSEGPHSYELQIWLQCK